MTKDVHMLGLINGQLIQARSHLNTLESSQKINQINIDGCKETIARLEKSLEELENPNAELIKKLDEMLCNYPEYSTTWIRADSWKLDKESAEVKYSEVQFSVQDPDNEELRDVHIIKGSDLVETYEKYGARLEKHFEETCEFFDMEMVDCFMQYHFYGSAIYG